jgi:NTP pyrophosphatase (non-canonical NTP hydrolase)
MSSYELADHIQALTLRARERIMGVGMRQYDDGIAGQRFESYTVERLLNELQDELLDVINYVGMLSIMVERAVTTTLREGSSDME